MYMFIITVPLTVSSCQCPSKKKLKIRQKAVPEKQLTKNNKSKMPIQWSGWKQYVLNIYQTEPISPGVWQPKNYANEVKCRRKVHIRTDAKSTVKKYVEVAHLTNMQNIHISLSIRKFNSTRRSWVHRTNVKHWERSVLTSVESK